jgi:hypothetical protein
MGDNGQAGKVAADPLATLSNLILIVGALSSAPAVSLSASAQTAPSQGRSLKRHAPAPMPPEGPLPAADPSAIARRWGVEIASMRLTSDGYMLEFRYKILDATKAQPIFKRGLRPLLRDEASGFQSTVPNPPTTGALRSTNDAKAGRTYFTFFANPSRFIKAGGAVTVTIGDFSVTGIPVTEDSVSAPSTGEEKDER